MTDVFEEVDQSIRQDTAQQVWKKAWPVLAIVFVVTLVGVGGWEFVKSQNAAKIEVDAKAFDAAMTALQKNDLAGAKKGFVQIGEDKDGFAVLANQMAAQVERQMANDPAAVELALKAAADGDKGLMGSLASLKLAYAKADTADLAEIEKLVKPVIDKGGPAGALARELVAAKVLASGDVERARTEYQALSLELNAPEGMHQRVEQTLRSLPPAAAAPAAAAPTAPAAAAPAAPAPAKPPSQ